MLCAKENLCITDFTYCSYDYAPADEVIVDDGLHNVYLTSINGYDTDTYDDRDSSNVVYNGFYFDGYSFMPTGFAFNDNVSSTMSNATYAFIREAQHFKNYLSDIDDYTELEGDIQSRVADLKDLLDESEYDAVKLVYNNYLEEKRTALDSSIIYEPLTDAELHSIKGIENSVPMDIPDVDDAKELSDREF